LKLNFTNESFKIYIHQYFKTKNSKHLLFLIFVIKNIYIKR